MDDNKRVRRIADIAEESGLRVWFSFAVCHIHRMYGPEIARFELDDQSDMLGRRIEWSAKTGDDSDVPAGQNNPVGGNNNFFRSNF